MRQLSGSRQKGLEIARNTFQYAVSNLLYVEGRGQTIRAFSFYDGDSQYPKGFLREWATRFDNFELDYGLAPPVINKVKSIINNVCGIEIQARFRSAARSHSTNEEDELLARALTHEALYIQEVNDIPLFQSVSFRDMLICGLGWGNQYLQDGQLGFDYVHPLNMVYDADDFSPFMTDSSYVHRIHWLTKQTMLMLWPKYKSEIEDLFYNARSLPVGSYSPEFCHRIVEWLDVYPIGGGDDVGSRIMVIETQRKERRTYYTGIDNGIELGREGREFQTFDEDIANEMIGKGEKIEEKEGYQIIRTVFCKDTVFEHGPLNPNLPNSSFTYIPGVYSRRASDGVPQGWLASMEDIQRIINFTKAKELSMVNSVRAIVDSGALVDGQTPEDLRQELARNDSIIFKNKEANISLHPNVDLAASQINTAKRLDEELQQVSGMYGDALGAQTNATASVSINSRSKNSYRTQIIGFDNLMFMKKRQAKLMFDLLQGSGIENRAIMILDDDEKEEVILNLARTANGKKLVFNDVRNLPLTIYIEQTHDYESSPEEQRENVQAILGNPNGMSILQSPQLLKLMGQKHWKKIAAEMQAINQQQDQREMMIQNQGQQNMPPQQDMNAKGILGIPGL